MLEIEKRSMEVINRADCDIAKIASYIRGDGSVSKEDVLKSEMYIEHLLGQIEYYMKGFVELNVTKIALDIACRSKKPKYKQDLLNKASKDFLKEYDAWEKRQHDSEEKLGQTIVEASTEQVINEQTEFIKSEFVEEAEVSKDVEDKPLFTRAKKEAVKEEVVEEENIIEEIAEVKPFETSDITEDADESIAVIEEIIEMENSTEEIKQESLPEENIPEEVEQEDLPEEDTPEEKQEEEVNQELVEEEKTEAIEVTGDEKTAIIEEMFIEAQQEAEKKAEETVSKEDELKAQLAEYAKEKKYEEKDGWIILD